MSHRATYNDGQTATRHDVLCIDASSSLVIQSGETTLATWRYDDIRAADSVSGLRFRTVGSDARLTLPENDHGQWLIHKCPNLKKGDNPTTRWPVWLGAGVFAVISLAGIFIYLIPQMSSAVVQMIPHSYEQKDGPAIARSNHRCIREGKFRQRAFDLRCRGRHARVAETCR